MRTAESNVSLSPSGRSAGADFAVDVESGADHRRVAQAAGELEEKSRSRRRPDELSLRGQSIAVDRALRAEVLDAEFIDVPADIGVFFLLVTALDPVVDLRKLLFPVEPDLARTLGQEVLLRHAVGP